MVVSRNPLMILQDDDDVLTTILSNEYGEDFPQCSEKNYSLQKNLPPKDTPHFIESTS